MCMCLCVRLCLMSQGQAAAPLGDAGEHKKVLHKLNKLVLQRLREAFKSAGEDVPKALRTDEMLLASALENRVRALKTLNVTVNVDGFQEFRKKLGS